MLFNILKLRRTYKNVSRLRQIAIVLIKHGLGRFLEQINLDKYIPISKRLRSFGFYGVYLEKMVLAERTRLAFEELGPTFIKLGQLLSVRPDLVTETFANEFKKLQDMVPPFPFNEAKRIVETELKKPLDILFAKFEEIPVAAASIAQVHRAELKDGPPVIVKVQRPDIEDVIETDINILYRVANLMLRYIPESRFFNPVGIVDEFSRSIRKEMDFLKEADNATRFQLNLRDSDFLYIPGVYYEYTTKRVLTMERLEGIRIDEFDKLKEEGFDCREIAKRGAEAYLKQILEDGFFHADPHPGNIFVLSDGRLGLMDFGIVGRLTDEYREGVAETFIAIVNRDFDRLVEQYIRLGYVSEDVDIETFRNEFKVDLVDFLEPLYGKTLKQINVTEYIDTITSLALKHRLRIPSDLLFMNKALLTIEGLGRRLDPDFDFLSVAEPYALRLLRKRISPVWVYKRSRKDIRDFTDFMVSLPKQMRVILRKAIKDDLQLRLSHIGFDKFTRDLDRSTNRIAFSLIVAAIIIASSVVIHAGGEKFLFGYPALGVIGFLIAFVFGLWLIIAILRSGRL